jgi:hypothetical protein
MNVSMHIFLASELLNFIIIQVPWNGFVWFNLALFVCTFARFSFIIGPLAVVQALT